MTVNPNYKMQVHLDRRDTNTRKWDTVARFEYGIHAMVAAESLSRNDGGEWRVADNRHGASDPMVIIYKEGVGI